MPKQAPRVEQITLSQIATLPGQASARDVLTESEAAARAARVSRVAYSVALDLVAGESTYRGDVTISFVATGNGPLFLDFRGKTIDRLEVNGQRIEPDWNGYRLILPADAVGGQMAVHIEYVNDYDTTG